VYAEPPIATELRVYDLCQLFPRGFAGGGIQDSTSVGLRLSCDGDEQRGYPSWRVRCLGSAVGSSQSRPTRRPTGRGCGPARADDETNASRDGLGVIAHCLCSQNRR